MEKSIKDGCPYAPQKTVMMTGGISVKESELLYNDSRRRQQSDMPWFAPQSTIASDDADACSNDNLSIPIKSLPDMGREYGVSHLRGSDDDEGDDDDCLIRRIRGGGPMNEDVVMELDLAASLEKEGKEWTKQSRRKTGVFRMGVNVCKTMINVIRDKSERMEIVDLSSFHGNEADLVFIRLDVSASWSKGKINFSRKPYLDTFFDDAVVICEELLGTFEELTDEIKEYQDVSSNKETVDNGGNIDEEPSDGKDGKDSLMIDQQKMEARDSSSNSSVSNSNQKTRDHLNASAEYASTRESNVQPISDSTQTGITPKKMVVATSSSDDIDSSASDISDAEFSEEDSEDEKFKNQFPLVQKSQDEVKESSGVRSGGSDPTPADQFSVAATELPTNAKLLNSHGINTDGSSKILVSPNVSGSRPLERAVDDTDDVDSSGGSVPSPSSEVEDEGGREEGDAQQKQKAATEKSQTLSRESQDGAKIVDPEKDAHEEKNSRPRPSVDAKERSTNLDDKKSQNVLSTTRPASKASEESDDIDSSVGSLSSASVELDGSAKDQELPDNQPMNPSSLPVGEKVADTVPEIRKPVDCDDDDVGDEMTGHGSKSVSSFIAQSEVERQQTETEVASRNGNPLESKKEKLSDEYSLDEDDISMKSSNSLPSLISSESEASFRGLFTHEEDEFQHEQLVKMPQRPAAEVKSKQSTEAQRKLRPETSSSEEIDSSVEGISDAEISDNENEPCSKEMVTEVRDATPQQATTETESAIPNKSAGEAGLPIGKGSAEGPGSSQGKALTATPSHVDESTKSFPALSKPKKLVDEEGDVDSSVGSILTASMGFDDEPVKKESKSQQEQHQLLSSNQPKQSADAQRKLRPEASSPGQIGSSVEGISDAELSDNENEPHLKETVMEVRDAPQQATTETKPEHRQLPSSNQPKQSADAQRKLRPETSSPEEIDSSVEGISDAELSDNENEPHSKEMVMEVRDAAPQQATTETKPEHLQLPSSNQPRQSADAQRKLRPETSSPEEIDSSVEGISDAELSDNENEPHLKEMVMEVRDAASQHATTETKPGTAKTSTQEVGLPMGRGTAQGSDSSQGKALTTAHPHVDESTKFPPTLSKLKKPASEDDDDVDSSVGSISSASMDRDDESVKKEPGLQQGHHQLPAGNQQPGMSASEGPKINQTDGKKARSYQGSSQPSQAARDSVDVDLSVGPISSASNELIDATVSYDNEAQEGRTSTSDMSVNKDDSENRLKEKVEEPKGEQKVDEFTKSLPNNAQRKGRPEVDEGDIDSSVGSLSSASLQEDDDEGGQLQKGPGEVEAMPSKSVVLDSSALYGKMDALERKFKSEEDMLAKADELLKSLMAGLDTASDGSSKASRDQLEGEASSVDLSAEKVSVHSGSSLSPYENAEEPDDGEGEPRNQQKEMAADSYPSPKVKTIQKAANKIPGYKIPFPPTVPATNDEPLSKEEAVREPTNRDISQAPDLVPMPEREDKNKVLPKRADRKSGDGSSRSHVITAEHESMDPMSDISESIVESVQSNEPKRRLPLSHAVGKGQKGHYADVIPEEFTGPVPTEAPESRAPESRAIEPVAEEKHSTTDEKAKNISTGRGAEDDRSVELSLESVSDSSDEEKQQLLDERQRLIAERNRLVDEKNRVLMEKQRELEEQRQLVLEERKLRALEEEKRRALEEEQEQKQRALEEEKRRALEEEQEQEQRALEEEKQRAVQEEERERQRALEEEERKKRELEEERKQKEEEKLASQQSEAPDDDEKALSSSKENKDLSDIDETIEREAMEGRAKLKLPFRATPTVAKDQMSQKFNESARGSPSTLDPTVDTSVTDTEQSEPVSTVRDGSLEISGSPAVSVLVDEEEPSGKAPAFWYFSRSTEESLLMTAPTKSWEGVSAVLPESRSDAEHKDVTVSGQKDVAGTKQKGVAFSVQESDTETEREVPSGSPDKVEEVSKSVDEISQSHDGGDAKSLSSRSSPPPDLSPEAEVSSQKSAKLSISDANDRGQIEEVVVPEEQIEEVVAAEEQTERNARSGPALSDPAGFKPATEDYNDSIGSSIDDISVVSIRSDLTDHTENYRAGEDATKESPEELGSKQEDDMQQHEESAKQNRPQQSETPKGPEFPSVDADDGKVGFQQWPTKNATRATYTTAADSLSHSVPYDEVSDFFHEDKPQVRPSRPFSPRPLEPEPRSLDPDMRGNDLHFHLPDHVPRQLLQYSSSPRKLTNVNDAFERLNRLKDRMRSLKVLMEANDKSGKPSETKTDDDLEDGNATTISGALAQFSKELQKASRDGSHNKQNPSAPSPIDEAYGALLRAQSKLRSLRALAKSRSPNPSVI